MKKRIDWNIKGDIIRVQNSDMLTCTVKHKGVKLFCIIGENEDG